MKYLLLAFISFGHACCSSGQSATTVYSSRTAHFEFMWKENETSQEEIDYAKEYCEQQYEQLIGLLGDKYALSTRVKIIFDGLGVKPDGTKYSPRVDSRRVMYLYKYQGLDYFDSFAHELVHALRIGKVAQWDPFFEEGFASAISDEVFPEKVGFPLFGYERSHVMAHLLGTEQIKPLLYLRANHSSYNRRCQLQSYIPREDFFCYLKNQTGLAKLLEFADSDQVGELSEYEEVWGNDLEYLEKEWLESLSTLDDDKVTSEGVGFLTQSPARFMTICN